MNYNQIRNYCFEVANKINTEEPNENIIRYIFAKYSHIPNECWNIIENWFVQTNKDSFFPKEKSWKYYIEEALKLTKTNTIKEIEVQDLASEEDWIEFKKHLSNLEQTNIKKEIKHYEFNFFENERYMTAK